VDAFAAAATFSSSGAVAEPAATDVDADASSTAAVSADTAVANAGSECAGSECRGPGRRWRISSR
jgi:hypothetical protein